MNAENKKIVNETLFEVFPSLAGEINEIWGPDQIQDWDSLNHLNMVMELSQKFDVILEFEDVLSIETIGDIFKVLNEKGIK